jgi:hypothetical protein
MSDETVTALMQEVADALHLVLSTSPCL